MDLGFGLLGFGEFFPFNNSNLGGHRSFSLTWSTVCDSTCRSIVQNKLYDNIGSGLFLCVQWLIEETRTQEVFVKLPVLASPVIPHLSKLSTTSDTYLTAQKFCQNVCKDKASTRLEWVIQESDLNSDYIKASFPGWNRSSCFLRFNRGKSHILLSRPKNCIVLTFPTWKWLTSMSSFNFFCSLLISLCLHFRF